MKKSMIKRIFTLILAMALVVSFVACSTEEKPKTETEPATSEVENPPAGIEEAPAASGEKTVVSFAMWDEFQKAAYDEIAAKFEAANPDIEIDIQLTPWDQYWTKLDAAAGAGNAADTLWMNVYANKYVEAGVLEPLSAKMEADGIDKNLWVDAMIDLYTIEDNLYVIPQGTDSVVVAYNKEIFDKYEVAYPEEGWTWDDMVKIGEELKGKIDAATGTEYPIVMELDAQPSIYQFISQNGADVYTADSNAFNTPAGIDAYQDIMDLFESGVMPSYNILSDTKGTDLFISGKAAMVYVGSWKASVINEASIASKTGLVTMPKRDVSNICAVGGIGYAINTKAANPEAAWQWVKFLGSEEAYEVLASQGIAIPALKSAQAAYIPAFTNFDATALVKQTENTTPFPTHPAMFDWMNDMTDINTQIFTGGVSVEEGCATLSNLVQEKMDEYNAG